MITFVVLFYSWLSITDAFIYLFIIFLKGPKSSRALLLFGLPSIFIQQYDVGLLRIVYFDGTMNYNNPRFSLNIFFDNVINSFATQNVWRPYVEIVKRITFPVIGIGSATDLEKKKREKIKTKFFFCLLVCLLLLLLFLLFSNWKCTKSRLAWNLNGYWFVFLIMKLLFMV